MCGFTWRPAPTDRAPKWEDAIFLLILGGCALVLVSGGIEVVTGEHRLFSARRLSRPVLVALAVTALRLIFSGPWRKRVFVWLDTQSELLREYHNRKRRCPWFFAVMAVGLPIWSIYLLNDRLPTGGDAVAIRQTAASLVLTHDLNIDEYVDAADPPYQAVRIDGHWYSAFPPAAGIVFLAPLVQIGQWINPVFTDQSVVRLEKLTASLVAAGACVVFFLALVRVVPPTPAWWLSVLLGLGTGLWSTGSHLISQHGPVCLLVSVVLWLELADRSAGAGAAIAGACSGLAMGVRPTAAIWAVSYGVFVLGRRPRDLVMFLAGALMAAAPFVICYEAVYGNSLGAYQPALASERWAASLWESVPANLVSPARGLFVWVPLAALAAGAIHHRGRRGLPPTLAMPVAGWLIVHLLVVSKYTHWWGGHSYGPRFLIDVMPAAILLAAPTFARLWCISPTARWLLLPLVGWSVFTQIAGAFGRGFEWVRDPVSVDLAPERVWDLADPPFFYDFIHGSAAPPPQG